MRKRADWMNSAVDPVLELLADSGLALPPGAIAYNLNRQLGNGPSRSSVTRAITDLKAYGLIRKPPDTKTYYEITALGREYLSGDLNAGGLDKEDHG